MPNFTDPKCSKELNDEDLKQVSGGSGECTYETFEIDDCFGSGMFIFVITQNGDKDSNWIYFDKYSDEGSSYKFITSDYYQPSYFNSFTYLGKKSTISKSFTGK